LQRSTLAKRAWLLFFLAAIAFYFYGLGRFPFLGPDEPRYAQVAREMLMRGDLITPTLGGHTWFEKPVLLYWMMEASFGAFGISEWAARIGPACSGLLSLLLVYWIGRRVERACDKEHSSGEEQQSERASTSGRAQTEGRERTEWLGLASGVALATSGGLIVFSRAASFDIVLTMAVTASLACFLVSELDVDERHRRWLLAGFYACVGVALLAKGLVGIVIPCGVVLAYLVLRRRRPDRQLLLSALWGGALALLVACVWYGPIIARHGWKFIEEFFIQHHFARYVSNKYHHAQSFYFYLPVMALLALPWTGFLLAALARLKSWDWRGPTALDKLRVFALVWLVVPVAFFSLSGSKLPGYVLPALPGAALLAGESLSRFLRGEGKAISMRATGAMLILFALGLLVYAARTGDIPMNCALFIAVLPLTAGASVILWTNKRELCLALVACAAFGVTLLAINCGAERVARRESMRDLLRLASSRGFTSAPIFQLHTVERTSEFYAAERVARDEKGEPVWLEDPTQVEEAARRSGDTILVIVSVGRLPLLTAYAPLETQVIGDNGALVLTAVRVRNNRD
jgi:4-amino-4-deoxy-L-arabinose transferase-like glycosyltransferase